MKPWVPANRFTCSGIQILVEISVCLRYRRKWSFLQRVACGCRVTENSGKMGTVTSSNTMAFQQQYSTLWSPQTIWQLIHRCSPQHHDFAWAAPLFWNPIWVFLFFLLACGVQKIPDGPVLFDGLSWISPIDRTHITSRTHTHLSHSSTSRLLTSSLSLGVPVPRATQCIWGAYFSQF